MKNVALIVGMLFCVLFAPASLAADGKLVTVKTLRGASQTFLFATPDNPTAGVILFVGGDGALGITDSGRIKENKNNFQK